MRQPEKKSDFRTMPFEDFIGGIKGTLRELFEKRNQNEAEFTERAFSPEFLTKVMDHVPLSVAIQKEYGGRGAKPRECISFLQACSYESIPLTLIFGINIALFLEPFGKYADSEIKPEVFTQFLEQQKMGGLMITEPAHGSDALNMKTSHKKLEEGYHLKGLKHWQGLTGMADYWLVAARGQTSSGALGRDVDLFVSEDAIPAQHIKVSELYNSNGLYPIPYGKNEVDIMLPHSHRLIPETTGIKMLMDTLHRSRLQFPGMATGFVKRALDEAKKHCNERMVRGKSLLQFDQIQKQILELETSFTICSAMCYRSSTSTSINHDLSLSGIEANTFKAVVSDLMQASAQTLMQLLGGKGYRIQSLGSRAIMDSRPFQIFEGPNAMLFTQLADMMLKPMFKTKQMNLLEFMHGYPLSSQAAQLFKKDINVTLERAMPQRKLVLVGEAMAKVILTHHVISLGDSGFNSKMIDNCIDRLRCDVSNLMNSYNNQSDNLPIENPDEDAAWLGCLVD